jgi:hypothetical protein
MFYLYNLNQQPSIRKDQKLKKLVSQNSWVLAELRRPVCSSILGKMECILIILHLLLLIGLIY